MKKTSIKCYIEGDIKGMCGGCLHNRWHTLEEHFQEGTCGRGYCLTRAQIKEARVKFLIENKSW